MKDEVKCGICDGNKWITHEKYPYIRKCANNKCSGLHPHDISKLRDIEGQIFDSDNNEMTDFDELESHPYKLPLKQNKYCIQY